MIIQILMKIVIVFTNIINKVVPDYIIPDSFITPIVSMGVYANQFDSVFPISAVLEVIIFALGFEIALLLFRAGAGLISLVRGGGGVNI